MRTNTATEGNIPLAGNNGLDKMMSKSLVFPEEGT